MDRNKGTSGFRSSKSKNQQPPGDLFVLGAKNQPATVVSSNVTKTTNSSIKTTSNRFAISSTTTASTSKGVKRENVASGSVSSSSSSSLSIQQPSAKKFKKDNDQQVLSAASILSDLNSSISWESNVLECDTDDLIKNVNIFLKANDVRKAVGFIAGALKKLSSSLRFKSEHSALLQNLITLVKTHSIIFTNQQIIHMLCSIIRNENLPKPKTSILTSTTSLNANSVQLILFSVNILMKSHQKLNEWPESFIRLYVDDALGDRIWIDHEDCKLFVDNILTAFKTKIPSKSYFQTDCGPLLPPPSSGSTGSSASVSGMKTNESSTCSNLYSISNDKAFIDLFIKTEDDISCTELVRERFLHCTDEIEEIVLEATREQLPKKATAPELINRNFVKFLTATSGLVNIRLLAVSRLDSWLPNPKLIRQSQELLAYCFCNCWNGPDTINSPKDIEIIASLVKMRIKNKSLIGIYMNCFREMFSTNSDENCLSVFMKQIILNEISSARNVNNYNMLVIMFQQYNRQHQYSEDPLYAEAVFGKILVEVSNEDNSLKALRTLFRDLIRGLRFEFNMYEMFRTILELDYKSIDFCSIFDFLCFSILILASNSQIRTSNLSVMLSTTYLLSNFRKQISMIQNEAVVWLYNYIKLTEKGDQLNSFLKKVLFLESIDTYVDIWPGESEQRVHLVRLVSDSIPVQQETIINICKMGIKKEYSLNPTEALDLIDVLIKRTAMAVSSSITCTTDSTISNLPALNILINISDDISEIVEIILALTEYRYPENVTLPSNYEPPRLAITALYWKAWTIILILVSHNPLTMGKLIWEQYPTVRTLIEMCITSNFIYTTNPEDQSNILQLNAIDKEKILELETHLANKTMTEQNSLLLSQVIVMRIHDKMYQSTPVGYFDQLEQMNRQYKLGHLLCHSRSPDFLLDIIQMQQSQKMPWLVDLVHNSPLSHLPVQCLCEYVLYVNSNDSIVSQKAVNSTYDMNAPLIHLKAIVKNEDLLTESYEILEYFFRRLSNLLHKSRNQALQALKMILNDTSDDNEWLTETISKSLMEIYKNENMNSLRSMIMVMLRQACLVETDPKLLALYIRFLCDAKNYDILSTNDLGDLLLDLSQLVVERNAILLPTIKYESVVRSLISIFYVYMQKIRGPQRDAYVWSECQDLVLVTWPTTGLECTVNILIVHASVILLTYSNIDNCSSDRDFNELLNMWFPLEEQLPKSYLVDTSEEALLIPDWLKLRMIRSDIPRLVDMSLIGLEAGQLVLFIQSFGISVNSMTRLLKALDNMSIGPEAIAIQEAVVDKSYMTQLVQVQHLRGAKGGDCFLQLLDPTYNKAIPDFMHDYEFRQTIHKKLPEQKYTESIDFKQIRTLIQNMNNKQYLRKLLQIIHLMAKNEHAKRSLLDFLNETSSEFPYHICGILKRHVDIVLKSVLKQNQIELKDEIVEIMEIETEQKKSNDFTIQIYRSNMTNLYNYAEELLQRDEKLNIENITKTLNFLQALIGNPRLWRGRDKNAVIKQIFAQEITILKPLIQSDILLEKLVDYIFLEANENDNLLESRISLLFNCLETTSEKWVHVMNYIKKKPNSDTNKILRMFQLMIYMRLPKVGNEQISVDPLINEIDTCNLDKMCHMTLTGFIAAITQPRKSNSNIQSMNMQFNNNTNLNSLELIIRKIVVTHPILFLRQLPVISSSLRGRAYLEFIVLKSGNHLTLFKRMLNILDLLQPHIFNKIYREDFARIIKSYMDLIQKHEFNKEIGVIVSKISELLDQWIKYSGLECDVLEYLNKSQKIPKEKLLDLITDLPEEPEPFLVNKIISEIRSTQSTSSNSAGTTNSGSSCGDNSSNTDRYFDSIKFLDYDNYCRLLLSPNTETRSWAYVQILKYLRKNPYDAIKSKALILAIFNCLDINQSHDVISALLDNLPDLIVYIQEYAWPILKTLFSMNINSNIKVNDVIIRIIDQINLQYGC